MRLIYAAVQVYFCPVLHETRLNLLYSHWSSLCYSPFHDTPHIFNRRKIWTAGRPFKHIHAVLAHAERDLALSHSNHWLLGKRRQFDRSMSLYNYNLPHQPKWYLHTSASHPCCGQRFTTYITLADEAFAPVPDNSLDDPFRLWHE